MTNPEKHPLDRAFDLVAQARLELRNGQGGRGEAARLLDKLAAVLRELKTEAETAPAPNNTEPSTAEAEEFAPVLRVGVEPGYWSRGHFYEGHRAHVDPTQVWALPVGATLYVKRKLHVTGT